MNADFRDHLSKLLKAPHLSLHPVSGGDISRSYKINTSKDSYFIKINPFDQPAVELIKKETKKILI